MVEKDQAPKVNLEVQEDPAAQGRKTPAPLPDMDGTQRESTINAFRLVETSGEENEEAERVWELTAASARQEGSAGVYSLEDVTLKFFKDNAVAGTLTGRKGSFDQEEQKGTLSGGIQGDSSEGYRVETSSLSWEKKTEKITTSDPVTISFGDSSVEGSGLDASLSMRTFTTKNVKGRIVIAGQ